jgi:hypothetical protein
VTHQARVFGTRSERLAGRPAARWTVSPAHADLVAAMPTAGLALLPAAEGFPFAAVPDGNRSAIVPSVTVSLAGRGYALSVKGIGAAMAPYAEGSFAGGGRIIGVESWFGHAPYGAQGEVDAARALEVTALADGADLNGFLVCPVVAVAEVPADVADAARGRYDYRRYRGRILQEHRLVPSNVRVYHESELALGRAPDAVLDALGVTDGDAFLDRFLASGYAALTLYARTLRDGPHGVEGLDYTTVWLDKDGVVASDGGLHFADLEGLDWRPAAPDGYAERVRDQLDRNFYELSYAAHAVLCTLERREGRVRTPAERRRAMAARIELALDDDRFARAELRPDALVLTVAAPGQPDVDLRIIDF